ncbi:hypothetical protein [Alkalispirochaeta alkalica]|uniref:hypothetical protein n=1 Tax=Alkalispirochaeta alkalica TaxID=46356 RepID=UPI00036F8A12|nr:hypothetical protein [Alkalispirochaeta alkalica]
MKSLNHYHQDYLAGKISWDRFVAEALKFMRKALSRRNRLGGEEVEDIIANFYPRLMPMTTGYQDQGSSFEAYLATTLYHSSREYVRRRIEHRKNLIYLSDEGDLWLAREELVGEPDITFHYGTHEPDLLPLQETGTAESLNRQFLFLFCKNVPLLSCQDCETFAAILDLPLSWITAIREYCQRHRTDRVQRRTILRERRDRHYSAMMRYQRDLHEADPAIRGRLKDRSDHHRRLWLLYIQRLKRQNLHLSNREVALLLGIPKGTVDSSLHTLGKRLASSLATQ